MSRHSCVTRFLGFEDRRHGFLPAAIVAILSVAVTAKAQDFASEAFVVESMQNSFVYTGDGVGRREMKARVRIQSEAGTTGWGVLTIPFSSDRQEAAFDYVRVKKRDGSVVESPVAEAQELNTAAAQLSPTFTDFKQKKLAVRGIEPGSLLEYGLHVVDTRPEVPGQFWFTSGFFRLGIVLDETVSLQVPADKYVLVKSPALEPQVETASGVKTYRWKTSQRSPLSESARRAMAQKPWNIQATTFRSWEEVGDWYRKLAEPRAQVTPAIQAKADELTKGLADEETRIQALYEFVSTKFRYVSLSFGLGHYQPHAADDVLSAGYGDCKDKSTLLAALLRAKGIESWPMLISVSHELDADVPAPSQFDHVITVVSRGGEAGKDTGADTRRVWLDSTSETMPYQMLLPALLHKQGLVVAEHRPAFLAFTPAISPVARMENVQMTGKVGADGTVNSHIDVVVRGEGEPVLRALFRAAGSSGYAKLEPLMARAIPGSGGEAKNLSVENPISTSKPLHYTYDYERKEFGQPGYAKLIAPLPFLVATGGSAAKPEKPIALGSLGTIVHRASMTLPEGYSVAIPEKVISESPFARFESSYALTNGTLQIERRMEIKQAEVSLGDWEAWERLKTVVVEDCQRSFALTEGKRPAKAEPAEDPTIVNLLTEASNALRARNAASARDFLLQAQAKNANHRGVWYMTGWLAAGENRPEEAMDDFRKEIQLHPSNEAAYLDLARMQRGANREVESAETMQLCVKNNGPKKVPVLLLAEFLIDTEQPGSAVEPLKAALKTAPKDVEMREVLLKCLFRSNKREEGVAMAKEILAVAEEDPILRNDAAYSLANAGVELPLAKEAAKKAMDDLESKMKATSIEASTQDDLRHVSQLAAVWDTYGWVCFQTGDLACAEKFVKAGWRLSERGEPADHLGQIYLKQGRRAEALHSWELAIAADPRMKPVSERLRLAGVTTTKAGEELSKMRTVGVPGVQSKGGSAEYFLLMTPHGIVESKFISGEESLRNAGDALKSIKPNFAWPDEGPERMVRRGIVSCSQFTKPMCQFTFLLPQTVRR